MIQKVELLDEAKELFAGARKSLLQGAKLLYEISTEEHWKARHESFAEFVENECMISQSMASKLVGIYTHYCVEGGISHAKLLGTDVEKLYLAAKLPGEADKQLAQATTLTRSELKQERDNPNDDCYHTAISVCSKCWKRL